MQASDDEEGGASDSDDEKQLDIKFNVGFGEDVGKKLIKQKKEKKEKDSETAWDSYQRKRKEKRKQKKEQTKQTKKDIKSKGFGNPEEDDKQAAELTLLVSEKHNGIKADFKGNTDDRRFEAVLGNKEFALDPTHKNYRKMAEGEFVKEQKNKRFKRSNE